MNDTTTCVDSNYQLIPYWGNATNEETICNLKEITHFTKSISSAISIIKGQQIRAKVLDAYNTEKGFCPDDNHRKCVFVSCFTEFVKDYREKLWDFADKHKGCKIDFTFNRALKQGFPLNNTVVIETALGKQFFVDRLPKMVGDIAFVPHYSSQAYEDKVSNKSVISVKGEKHSFVDTRAVGHYVQSKFQYQAEIRISLHLLASSETIIPEMRYAYIPIDFSEIEEITVIYGCNANRSQLDDLYALQKTVPQLRIYSENEYYIKKGRKDGSV